LRRVADLAFYPAGQCNPWKHPAEQRAHPTDHDHGAEGYAGESYLSRTGNCPILSWERVIAFSGTSKDQPWVHMEILEGSYGGRYGLDGMDTVDTLYANTRNNPIEDIESHLPLRVERYELREDVVAAGQWRGGIGSVREFTYLTDGGFSVEGDGQKYQPWGFAGGADGYPGQLIMMTRSGEGISLPSKVPYKKAKEGDRLLAFGPSGGGYGDPFKRNPNAVLDNVLDGLFSAEVARERYGVELSGGVVDTAVTAKLRKARQGDPTAD
jgi:N-methylhydantoinase B